MARKWMLLLPQCKLHCAQGGTTCNLVNLVVCRGKTNFFEKRVGEYQKAGVMAGLQTATNAMSFDEDF